jgi:hypothetical protein
MDKNIIYFIFILLIIALIFYMLNIFMKKSIEKFGIYCGSYNLDKSTAQKYCSNDPECAWKSIKDPNTGLDMIIKKGKFGPMIQLGNKEDKDHKFFNLKSYLYENKKEMKRDWVGTLTFQPLAGGFPVKASTIVGSWRITYEASTLLAPSIKLPGLRINRNF